MCFLVITSQFVCLWINYSMNVFFFIYYLAISFCIHFNCFFPYPCSFPYMLIKLSSRWLGRCVFLATVKVLVFKGNTVHMNGKQELQFYKKITLFQDKIVCIWLFVYSRIHSRISYFHSTTKLMVTWMKVTVEFLYSTSVPMIASDFYHLNMRCFSAHYGCTE